ncbi:MAG: TIGR04338 family metallohydrolase [Actinomycetota bacterium]|nr:TIGR04338 family metallohydrolase [Actinomycetota bacterium]
MARIGVSTGIDSDRQSVYSVEDAWAHALDRGGSVDFFGSHFQLPNQRILGDLSALQRTADAWLASDQCLAWYPNARALHVRARKGGSRAHYESTGVIAIPLEADWACRETVLAHEVAHHLSWDQQVAPHDANFRLAMTRVAEIAFGPQAALLLRAGYHGSRLDIAYVN